MALILMFIVSAGLNLQTFMTNTFVFERQREIMIRINRIQGLYDEVSCREYVEMNHVRDPYDNNKECF